MNFSDESSEESDSSEEEEEEDEGEEEKEGVEKEEGEASASEESSSEEEGSDEESEEEEESGEESEGSEESAEEETANVDTKGKIKDIFSVSQICTGVWERYLAVLWKIVSKDLGQKEGIHALKDHTIWVYILTEVYKVFQDILIRKSH